MRYFILSIMLLSCGLNSVEGERDLAIRILKDAYRGTSVIPHADSGSNLIIWPIANNKVEVILPYDSVSILKFTEEQLKEYNHEINRTRKVRTVGLLERENGIEVLLSTASVRAWRVYSDVETDSIIAIVRVGGPFSGRILNLDSLFSTNGVEYVRKFLDIE